MNDTEWRRQAWHFDHKPPFIPGPWILREKGFELQYILKDVAIARALAGLDLEPSWRALDVGCGEGILLDRIGASYNVQGYGVDVSLKSLCRGMAQSLGGFLGSQADGMSLPFADNSFDLVTSFDVLEHMERPLTAVDEMVRVVRPGGKILCYAVSRKNKFSFIWLFTLALESLGIDPWSPACHAPELLVDPTEVSSRFEKNGCQVDKSEPFHAFFTIIFDLTLLGFYLTVSRAARALCSRIPERWSPRWLLRVGTAICQTSFSLLRWLDSPWTKRGVSNGVLIAATKAPQHTWVASSAADQTIWPASERSVASLFAGDNCDHSR